jgi:hypothetical protein
MKDEASGPWPQGVYLRGRADHIPHPNISPLSQKEPYHLC